MGNPLYAAGRNWWLGLGIGDVQYGNAEVWEQAGVSTEWASISCGHFHSAAIRNDGTLWTTGSDYWGETGNNGVSTEGEFVQIGTDTWSSVVCGYDGTLAIRTDGTLWVTGRNFYGQLGLGDTTQRDVLTQVGVLTTWSKVYTGYLHSIAIKADGTLWGTGFGYYGELGLGDYDNKDEFTQIGSSTDWDNAAAFGCTLAIKTNGTLWATGRNNYGQLGLNDTTNRNVLTQVGALTIWSLVACGNLHSLAVKTDGTLLATGYNGLGALGLGDTTDRDEFEQVGALKIWSKIACGGYHSLAIKTDKTLWVTGLNDIYQLGLGDFTDRDEFEQVAEAVMFDGISANDETSMALAVSWEASRHRGNTSSGSVLFNGKQYVGDYANGKIYQLDMDTYTDDGLAITRTRRTQIINKERVNVIHNKVEVDFEHGVGLDVASDADGYDPQATLKWSDDEGNTWSTGLSVGIGAYQKYGTRAIWRRLGKSRNRIYELTIEEPVKVVITGSYADLKACRF